MFLAGFPAGKGWFQIKFIQFFRIKKGFWWFGTANGLQRYDGRKIIMFRVGPDQEDYLPSQAISQIIEDKSGKFWVRCGTEVGLFDPATFRYRRASIKTDREVAPRASYYLWQSPQGEIIVTIRNNGFYTYDSASHSFLSGKNSFSLPEGWLPIRMTDDAGTGRYWIVADSGLSLFDPIQKKLFNRYNNPEHIQLFTKEKLNEHITSFFIDHSRRAWIVAWRPRQPKADFYCYDLRSNVYCRIPLAWLRPLHDIMNWSHFMSKRMVLSGVMAKCCSCSTMKCRNAFTTSGMNILMIMD
jgi:hypothetical protein